MIMVGLAVVTLGLICIVSKKSILGVLIGIQLIIMGCALAFVQVGLISGANIKGHLFGIFVVAAGTLQLCICLALSTRLFGLRKGTTIKQLRSMRH